jgi:hypothetical protein
VLYLAAERAPEILAAQAEWRTWLLRGPPARCLLKGCRPPRSGDGALAAFTLALGLVPVRDPAGVPSPAAVTGRAGGLTGPGPVRYSLQCSKR